MDVKILRNNGATSYLSDISGVQVTDFIVESIPVAGRYTTPEGSVRQIDLGADLPMRTITVPLLASAHDAIDFPMLRDAISELIVTKESFRIQEVRHSAGAESEYGKAYRVRVAGGFSFEQFVRHGKTELTFETTELPYAESIGTTADFTDGEISADSALWGYGMGLIENPDSRIYTHEGASFRIYNAGNAAIHPFEQDLRIVIEAVTGSTASFTLRNTANGAAFTVNEAVVDTQKIVIDGPTVTSNGLQYLRKTNREFIALEPGWNDFTVEGADSARVTFIFRFYYV